jgi:hypothetical protein
VKQETQNRTLEPTGRPTPSETPSLTGMDPGLTRQDSDDRVFVRVLTRTNQFLRPKPGLPAGYPDQLLSLCLEGGVHGPNPMQRESIAPNKSPTSTVVPGGSNSVVDLHQIGSLGQYPR